MKDKFFYGKWIFTIIIAYFFIKMIDNYQYFVGILSSLVTILKPFIIAIVIAYMIDPIVKFLENKTKIGRGLGILLSYSVIICITGLFIFFVIPSIGNSILEIIESIPSYSNEIQTWFTKFMGQWGFLNDPTTIDAISASFKDLVPKLGEIVSSMLSSMLDSIVSITVSIGTYVVNLILAFIISIYLLIDKKKVLSFTKKATYMAIRNRTADKLFEILSVFNKNIGTYIIAKSIDSFFVGLVSFIGLEIIGAKYALLFGIICGITNMIPYFGPILGMVPTVLINLLYDPMTALWALIFLVVVQQIEGNIIEPKFVGGKLGLSPLLTLLAVAIGGGFFGILGMILSVPVMGVIKIYVERIMEKKDSKDTKKPVIE